ncbi:23S rRNA (adenine(2503)-C(2))-methyltransferase RlmN [Fibrobacterota bacterium]
MDLLSLPFSDWQKPFREMGKPGYRADQVREWIFKHFITNFDEMSNLPKTFRDKLKTVFILQTLEIVQELKSNDGTVKWILRTADNMMIECVMIPDGKRRSICLSSQVGCGMGCRFCSTAKMGLGRNLSTGEIVQQYLLVSRYLIETQDLKLTNAIFMGMGEPLQNLETVAAACKVFSSEKGFGLSKKKITVSTSGLVPGIIKWVERAPEYKLAISLNSSINAVRSDLMPVNRRYPLGELLKAADYYIKKTGQRLTFEYILIKDKTCTPQAARELKRIASRRGCKINLIPLNGAESGSYSVPSQEEILKFKQILISPNFSLVERKPRGRDILAACGQLVHQQQKKVA